MTCFRSVLLLVALAANCLAFAQSDLAKVHLLSRITTQLPHFSSIRVIGDLDVEIIGGKSRSTVASPRVYRPVYTKLVSDTLYLCANVDCVRRDVAKLVGWKKAKKNSLLLVQTNELSKIDYRGTGELTGINLRSHGLSLFIDNNGKTVLKGAKLPLRDLQSYGKGEVKINSVLTPNLNVNIAGRSKVTLSGIAGLSELTYGGNGNLYMLWLNSCHIAIHGHGHAQAFIAGVAGKLDIELSRQAYLDAKYLRAQDIDIKTQETSRADIWARGTLTALASEQSNIYYYRLPSVLNDYRAGSGAILPMIGLNVVDVACHAKPLYSLARCPAPPRCRG